MNLTLVFITLLILVGMAAATIYMFVYCNRKREQVFDLLDKFPDMVWIIDADGKYSYVNDAFARTILMCERKHAIGKTIRQLTNEQLLLGIVNNFGTLFSATDEEVKSVLTSRRFLEIGKIRGSFVALETLKVPLVKGATCIGMLGVARDVTHDVLEHALLDEYLIKGDMEAFKELFNEHKFKYITAPAKSCYPEFMRKIAAAEIA